MTETRWTKIGTFTTQIEADEFLAILVAARIPYSQSGVLGPHRTGSIEFHVPNDFVDAAKAAFAEARDRPRRAAVQATPANAVEAAEQNELDVRIDRERSRRRNFARASIAMLAIVCVGGGAQIVRRPEPSIPIGVVLFAVGAALIMALIASFRRARES